MSLENGFVPSTLRGLRLTQETTTPPEAAPIVIEMLAHQALNVGDAVFISPTGRANKSTTALSADYVAKVGIVVGGQQTDNRLRIASTDVGVAAASAAGETVLVCIYGVCWGVAAAALATIATKVTGSVAVAGRVDTPNVASTNTIGYTLSAAAGAGSAVKLLVGVAN